jgi:hypothetical protein
MSYYIRQAKNLLITWSYLPIIIDPNESSEGFERNFQD